MRPNRMFQWTVVALLLVPWTVQAAVPKIKTADKSYEIGQKIVFEVEGVPKGVEDPQFIWKIKPYCEWVRESDRLYVWAKPGSYEVDLTVGWISNGKLTLQQSTTTFKVVGKIDPGPQPPDPPNPDDPPKPPPPDPKTEAPIKAPGFRVLVLYETKKASEYPKEQQSILYGDEMWAYLSSVTTKDAANPKGSCYIWDADAYTDPIFEKANTPQYWRDAYKRPKTSLPWIIISDGDGKRGYEGPLPKNVKAAIDLVKQYEPKKRR